jgi:hypothetical protein
MPVERSETVLIFGAGASAGCGTPVTNEILWRAFCDPEIRSELERDPERKHDIEQVEYCLIQHFHIPDADRRRKEDFPSLTLLLSILDLSIERNRPFAASERFPRGMSREELARARRSIEFIIFAVLDYYLRRATGSAQRDLMFDPHVWGADGPQIISLNYDVIADTVLCALAQRERGDDARLDYGCDVRTEAYKRRRPYGKLLKLHGSLNWLYCPGCQALQIGMSESGRNIADSTMLRALYDFRPLDRHYLCSKSGCTVCSCQYCDTPLRAVMITPSFVKDYRNPHIERVWYEAEYLLRRCRRAYVIGYSLPDDDLEVIHLLRRGLEGCDSRNITVVTNADDQAMRRRYVSLFGKDIDWYTRGFEEWMGTRQLDRDPGRVPRPPR